MQCQSRHQNLNAQLLDRTILPHLVQLFAPYSVLCPCYCYSLRPAEDNIAAYLRYEFSGLACDGSVGPVCIIINQRKPRTGAYASCSTAGAAPGQHLLLLLLLLQTLLTDRQSSAVAMLSVPNLKVIWHKRNMNVSFVNTMSA